MNETQTLAEAIENLKKITSDPLKLFVECAESHDMHRLAWVHPKFQKLDEYIKTFGLINEKTQNLFNAIVEVFKSLEFTFTEVEPHDYVGWLEKNLERMCNQAALNYVSKDYKEKRINYHNIADMIYREFFEAGLNYVEEDN